MVTIEQQIPKQRRPVGTSIGGPLRFAWREGTLTRAKELESLADWLGPQHAPGESVDELLAAIDAHLEAAREAARHGDRRLVRRADGAMLERAISNLDAAHADLLQVAPASYLLGQIPSLLNEVQRHLMPNDARRQEFERLAGRLGIHPAERQGPLPADQPISEQDRQKLAETGRNEIVSIVRGARSAALREQLRVRSFRNVLLITAGVMTLLAITLAVLGLVSPATVPLCFQPEQSGRVVVICPTGQSGTVTVDPAGGPAQPRIDAVVNRTARPGDIAVIEVIGLIAASVAAATALRRIRGSSEPHGLPAALALLKLPTGAVTAVLGLLLMRGQFVPGLSALDTSGQILAWAIVFGYAQQLFTRFVDQQGDTVLNQVRGSKNAKPAAPAG